MKGLRHLGVVFGVMLAFGCLWPVFRLPNGSAGRGYQGPPVARFVGYAGDGDGPGTRLAMFNITNERSYPAFVYPYVSIEAGVGTGTNVQAQTVNAPTAYGFHLYAGSGATVHVPIPPGSGASRVRFALVRDYYHLSAKLTRLPEELRALWTGTPVAFTNEYFYSDWFQP